MRFRPARCLCGCQEWVVIDIRDHELVAEDLTRDEADRLAVAAARHQCFPAEGRRIVHARCGTTIAAWLPA